MIKYQLACCCGHEFEAWFASSVAYDKQSHDNHVVCPLCMSSAVNKRPMAPAIVSSKMSVARRDVDKSLSAAMPATGDDADTQQRLAMLRELKTKVLENSENVGGRFAEEARNIHFGDAELRAIHGEASIDEARQLGEDGIAFGILPQLPEDNN